MSASDPASTRRAESVYHHRVTFYETDAMAIVHHSNYVRYFELARVLWLDEHDVPYRDYMAQDRHFAATAIELHYRRSSTFDDELAIACWLDWARGASIRLEYEITRRGESIATGATEHAMVNGSGRPVRIPKERRQNLLRLARRGAP